MDWLMNNFLRFLWRKLHSFARPTSLGQRDYSKEVTWRNYKLKIKNNNQ